jgi:hypothetical protein
MTDTIAVKTGQSTNFQPVFEIVSWVERPDVLGPRTVPAPKATLARQPAEPVTEQRTAAPVQQAAQAAARPMADAMPF